MWKLGLRPAAQLPEKKYINGIFVAVCSWEKILQDVFSGSVCSSVLLPLLSNIFIINITVCGEGAGRCGGSVVLEIST
jgi:hypothetical protein